jgi:dephospho-CoA kinase
VTREVMGRGARVLEPIFDRFGRSLRNRDGSLDRAALGRIVFADPAALADLEAIVHPVIRPALEAALAATDESMAPAVVLEAIKLVEAGYHAGCDEVWLVACEPATQRERLVGRGLDPAVAEQRIASQADLAVRLRPFATRIVSTEGSADRVRDEVRSLFAAALEGHRRAPIV